MNGMKISGTGGVSGPAVRTSATTPTTSRHSGTPGTVVHADNRLPTGFWPGHSIAARRSLISTTGAAPGARSAGCNVRPRRSDMPIASTY
ncbi:hypothetical protein D3C83_22290 [compost metagenome]